MLGSSQIVYVIGKLVYPTKTIHARGMRVTFLEREYPTESLDSNRKIETANNQNHEQEFRRLLYGAI